MEFGFLKEVSNLIRHYVIRVRTDIVQSLRMGVGGRHKSWVETGGKKFVEHIGLIRVRCSSGRSIMKSVRNCRGLSFLRVAQNFLESHLLLARSSKKSLLATQIIIYNGVAERSIFQQSVMAFSTFKFLIQARMLADCKSDFTVNPGGVGFYRN